ncbi:hypothetical protein AKO1_015747 [Acrasis kona]|uniref:Uncharacterized protein n=1 Tax=Acrasis kona TaxID=1008807 RepID=A0AAW2ZGM0_9EUKA
MYAVHLFLFLIILSTCTWFVDSKEQNSFDSLKKFALSDSHRFGKALRHSIRGQKNGLKGRKQTFELHNMKDCTDNFGQRIREELRKQRKGYQKNDHEQI